MRRYQRPALVTAGYVALTAFMYWPGVRHISTKFMSDGGDGADFIWDNWALPNALAHGRNPFSTTKIFFPVGARLAFHTTIALEAFVTWPLAKVLGVVTATNLVLLLAVPAAGIGAYLLARHEGADDRAAFVAGVAYVMLPQHAGRIAGHWNLHHSWVLPFGLLLLLRLYDRPTWRRAAALGAMAAAVFLTDLTFFVFWLGAGLIITAWRWREALTRQVLPKLAVAAAAAAVLSAPLLASMASDLLHSELDRLNEWGGAEAHSANLVGFVTPWVQHPLWGSLGRSVHSGIFGLEEYPYVGLLILGLAVAALFMGDVRKGPWPLIAVGSMVLALGPYLHVNTWTGSRFHTFGRAYSVPLPYGLFRFVPVLSGLRIPGRFAFIGALALGVIAAVALTRVMRDKKPRVQWAIAAAALVITFVELLPAPRVPLQSARVPAAYGAISRSPDRGAVLEIPLFWRHGFGQYGDNSQDHTIFLYYATKHGRPVSTGMVARLPGKRFIALFNIPVYRQVLALQHQVGFTDPATFTAPDLRRLGIGFVVYHRSRPMPDVLRYVEGLRLERLADDGDTVVWHVPRG